MNKFLSFADIVFNFVQYGTDASQEESKDSLFLDVGNALKPGVIDQHQLASYTGSTAGLILMNPDLVLGAVDPARKAAAKFTISVPGEATVTPPEGMRCSALQRRIESSECASGA